MGKPTAGAGTSVKLAVKARFPRTSHVPAPDGVSKAFELLEEIVQYAESIKLSALDHDRAYLVEALEKVHTYLRQLHPRTFWRLQEELEDLTEALLHARDELRPIAETNLLVQAFAWRRLSDKLHVSSSTITHAYVELNWCVEKGESAKAVLHHHGFTLRDLQIDRDSNSVYGGSDDLDIEEFRARFPGEENVVLLRRAMTEQGKREIVWHIEFLKALAMHKIRSDVSLLGYTLDTSRHPWYLFSVPSLILLMDDLGRTSYIERLLLAIPYTLITQRFQRFSNRQGSTTNISGSIAVDLGRTSVSDVTCNTNVEGETPSPNLDETDLLVQLLLSDTAYAPANDSSTGTSEQSGVVASGQIVDAILSLDDTTVQSVIDHLNKILDHLSPSNGVFAVTSRILRKLCVRKGSLPKLFHLIEADIHKTSEEPIGTGGYATVYMGLYREMAVALKCFQIHDGSRIERIYEIFCKEALRWSRLRHENITPFLGITNQIAPLCLVSKWMKYGTIVSSLKHNPKTDRLSLLVDVVRGLKYLHSFHLIHGDLKGANILVDEHSRACLCDFGIATVMYDPDIMQAITKSSESSGTTRWMAPERMDPDSLKDTDYEPCSSDVYSLSMVVWEVYSGKIPFHECQHDAQVVAQVLIKDVRPQRTEDMRQIGLADDIWAIVEAGWSADWRARPTLDHFLGVFSHAAESCKTVH